jgi:eukaryotic-like serine/threonine-protein kinase
LREGYRFVRACNTDVVVMASCQYCGTGFESGRFCPACGRAVRSTHETRDPLIDSVIDGMRFDAVLGRGMTGCVYRATQLSLDRPLAIKVPTLVLAGDPIAVRRFRREALALARIHHPGVVGVHAVGELPDRRPYLAIDFLDGKTLELAMGSTALATPRAVDLALQIAEALAEVHTHDIVHRDLKPDNVMLVRPQVGGERAVLIDFGLALPVAGADATRLTAGGGLVGTPHYMAPEQVQGDDIDGRADIYALGATLYRMLTGKVPFDGTGVEVVVAHLARSVQPVRALAPDVPAELEAIVMKCLAKRVSDRWPTAAELAKALAEIDDGPRTPRAKRVSAVPPLGAPVASPAAGPAASSSARRPTADERSESSARRRALAARRGPGGSTRARVGRAQTVPAPAPARRSRAGLIATALAAIAIGGVAVALVIGERDDATAAPDAGDPAGSGVAGGGTGSATAPEPDPAATRALIVDDGGLTMRVAIPKVIAVGAPVRFALEIWDDEGAAVAAAEIVVTVEAESGDSRGFAATRAGLGRTVFAFTTRFAEAGRYKVRVFPPIGDATFVVDIEVVPA